MFAKVLIANRGAIACRISRTLRRMGVASVAVYSEADRDSLHVQQCDEAVFLGPPQAAQSYLVTAKLLEAARKTGAQAIHPGYGFLSEDAELAQACADAGVVFIGPTPDQLRAFGLKHTARQVAIENDVPLLPGSGLLDSAAEARREAKRIGYPVMLKSSAGGGGIGMRLCQSPDELEDAYEAVEQLSKSNFGGGGLYLERFIAAARHIEVQVFGDGRGEVIALGERDCSMQRRNQKVIEETPAPGLAEGVRERLFEAAVRLTAAVDYQSAGTVEFLLDNASDELYFLEVNTRLQVEHGVTEEVAGVDLVEWMVLQAAGEMPPLGEMRVKPAGASIQARLYAEDPGKGFQPSSGKLTHVQWPEDARIETWVEPGCDVTPFYDPMLAKIIVHAPTRAEAAERLAAALEACEVAGIETNLRYLSQVAASAAFAAGDYTTSSLRDFAYVRLAVDVREAGAQTTIQDYPGRLGYWNVGVPPSGPIDSYAFRAANRLVGNPEGAPALETTLTGPTLQFSSDTRIAVTGADFRAKLDGVDIPRWTALSVRAGSTLQLGAARGAGARAYIAFAGGLQAPEYLGSRSAFILGQFGGQFGRVLRAGDVLHLAPPPPETPPRALPGGLVPEYSRSWTIGVLYGPHGAPDFFTEHDIDTFFATAWTVHHNSDRTGIRLIGPKPEWARTDGGEAGLHPSNIHDNAYAVGSVDFTGDMPVILGPDGPSLGGFVCPATIVEAERWKMGQLKAGDTVRFQPLSIEQAARLAAELDKRLETLSGALPALPEAPVRETPILREKRPEGAAPAVAVRADGDRNLLIEFGPNVLDLDLRLRVHALETELRRAAPAGIVDLTPGVRSLQIHYDSPLSREELLELVDECERRMPDIEDLEVPSRTVRLPLSWDDPATRLAIEKYMQGVRPDAPWCPSNLEFIRRMNGLDSIDDVRAIVFGADYLVLGLGDVYLGAPVATPVDPRHRLVTTKYNPARTWTPQNAVGIGGAYLCVYGMEGPGGYQFVGRTVQMWNTARTTREFREGAPWLLRFFDRIQFYPVSAEELLEIREEFPRGGYPLSITEETFHPRRYREFLESIRGEAAEFRERQQQAFHEERERWAAAGQAEFMAADLPEAPPEDEATLAEGLVAASSPATASVWNIAVEAGQRVEAGQKLIVLEAMKMELVVTAPASGVVERISPDHGALVYAGQTLVVIRENV